MLGDSLACQCCSARSQTCGVRSKSACDVAEIGGRQASQVFELNGPAMAYGTSAKFFRRGLSLSATEWPGCKDESRRTRMLMVLDSALGPRLALVGMNRPLERPSTMTGSL